MQQMETLLLISGAAFLILSGLLFATRRQLWHLKDQLANLTASILEINDRILRLEKLPEDSAFQPKRTRSTPKITADKEPVIKRREAENKPAGLQGPPPKIQLEPVEAAQIITRTTRQDGKTTDTWVQEKVWNKAELTELVTLHRSGKSVQQIAIHLRVDARDVVYGLAREIFDCEGDLEDLKMAPNDGKKWLPTDHKKLIELFASGVSIERIAFRMGRTQLAVVWRLLDYQMSF